MNTVRCPACGVQNWDDPAIRAVLVCTCGQFISGPDDPWGPGSRVREADKRYFGTDAEREVMTELGLKPGIDPADQPTAYQLLRERAARQENGEEE